MPNVRSAHEILRAAASGALEREIARPHPQLFGDERRRGCRRRATRCATRRRRAPCTRAAASRHVRLDAVRRVSETGRRPPQLDALDRRAARPLRARPADRDRHAGRPAAAWTRASPRTAAPAADPPPRCARRVEARRRGAHSGRSKKCAISARQRVSRVQRRSRDRRALDHRGDARPDRRPDRRRRARADRRDRRARRAPRAIRRATRRASAGSRAAAPRPRC